MKNFKIYLPFLLAACFLLAANFVFSQDTCNIKPCKPFQNNDLYQVYNAIKLQGKNSGTATPAGAATAANQVTGNGYIYRVLKIDTAALLNNSALSVFRDYVGNSNFNVPFGGNNQSVFRDYSFSPNQSVFKDQNAFSVFLQNSDGASIFKDVAGRSIFKIWGSCCGHTNFSVFNNPVTGYSVFYDDDNAKTIVDYSRLTKQGIDTTNQDLRVLQVTSNRIKQGIDTTNQDLRANTSVLNKILLAVDSAQYNTTIIKSFTIVPTNTAAVTYTSTQAAICSNSTAAQGALTFTVPPGTWKVVGINFYITGNSIFHNLRYTFFNSAPVNTTDNTAVTSLCSTDAACRSIVGTAYQNTGTVTDNWWPGNSTASNAFQGSAVTTAIQTQNQIILTPGITSFWVLLTNNSASQTKSAGASFIYDVILQRLN